MLAIPTLLLSVAPNLTVFASLRILQGLCMASAFALTLAYLGEECSAADAGGAFAAYITGNVASNLFGRLVSAAVADHLGIAANFVFFTGLNLAGAALAYATIHRAKPMVTAAAAPARWRTRGATICATRRYARPSASASASCSPSSAPSPSSTSFWCASPSC